MQITDHWIVEFNIHNIYILVTL